MPKKPLKRIHHSVPLTPEEVARDRELRQKIQQEFPPLVHAGKLPVLSTPLKQAISKSELPLDQLARESGIPEVLIRRFMAGEGDLRLAVADQLAHALGLRLVEN